MIPATQPITVTTETVIYDQWTPTSLSGSLDGPGRFSVTVRLTRSRTLPDQTSELSSDPTHSVELRVANVNDPISEAYPAPIRAAVQQAVGAIIQATAALAAHRDIL